MTEAGPLIRVENLTKYFGGLRAVHQISFVIPRHQITALIGPNGAGKTTVFNCITGQYRPNCGRIQWLGRGGPLDLGGLQSYQVTRLGLARTFQNIRVFPNMTTLENVMVARHVRTKAGILGAIFRPPRVQKEEQLIIARAMEILGRVDLLHRADELAKNLPYGEQRRLEIARALATEPELLLLDEPAAGLNLNETMALDRLVRTLQKDLNLTALLIEHDMKFVMNLSNLVVVLDHGELVAVGPPEVVSQDERVIAAYLGEDPE